MIDLGVVMGMLGFLSGVVAIIYSHIQATAERLQALEATRMSTLQSNSELLERFRRDRRNMLSNPKIRDEFCAAATAAHSPLAELTDFWKSEDGVGLYVACRDSMDTAQDAYFLRRRGIMSDEHWYRWIKVAMPMWARVPTFVKIFHSASGAGFLHPDFVKFYEPIFRGGEPGDPGFLERQGRTKVNRAGYPGQR